MAAKSISNGTPEESGISTRTGWNATSRVSASGAGQRVSVATSSAVTVTPSSCRARFSSSTLSETGMRSSVTSSASPSAGRLKNAVPSSSVRRIWKESCIAFSPVSRSQLA